MGCQHHLLALMIALAGVQVAKAAATYDQRLTTSLRSGLKSDVVFFTFQNIGFPKRATAAANQVLGSITFPGQSRFSVVLDRQMGKVIVETSVDDDVKSVNVDGSWVVRPKSTIKSILVELRQKDGVAVIYVDCKRAGLVNLEKVPREMAEEFTNLRVYRDKHTELSVDWDTNALHLLEKLECPMGEDDGNVQAQANEIYTYRRAANDDPNDKNKNARPVASLKWRPPSRSLNTKGTLLVDTLKELIETIKDLRIEVQTQREETALLRDAILNCEACKPGRNRKKNRFG